MKRYINGESGILAYECGSDFIRIQFTDGSIYLYTYESAGVFCVEKMKKLAQRGKGLNTFINRMVRGNYSERLS